VVTAVTCSEQQPVQLFTVSRIASVTAYLPTPHSLAVSVAVLLRPWPAAAAAHGAQVTVGSHAATRAMRCRHLGTAAGAAVGPWTAAEVAAAVRAAVGAAVGAAEAGGRALSTVTVSTEVEKA